MEERNVTVTIDKAREWYNCGNESLREVALQDFTEVIILKKTIDL